MNKIQSKAYCVKRLKDSGYNVDKLDSVVYTKEDKRNWSILLDNGVSTILVTSMKDYTVHLYDGDRYFDDDYKKIDNIRNLIEYLHEKGITNKHYLYGKGKEQLEDK